jgi:hypothetical protein
MKKNAVPLVTKLSKSSRLGKFKTPKGTSPTGLRLFLNEKRTSLRAFGTSLKEFGTSLKELGTFLKDFGTFRDKKRTFLKYFGTLRTEKRTFPDGRRKQGK